MEGIKDTILLFCNLINKMYSEQLLSIHFSHGKFNRTSDHTVVVFWRIIHRIVCDQRNCSDIVYCVKKLMLTKFGYRMASFYALPDNSTYGSRELLLALGKLVVDNKLEEAFDKIISKSVLISEFGQEPDRKKCNINECKKVELDNSEDFLKMLMFKAGKIKNNLRAIDRLNEIRQKETAKIHEETSSIPCISHLSVWELLVLSNKKVYYAGYQKHLQAAVEILDAYFLWLKRKKEFIKWIMDRNDEHNVHNCS
ncbi:uncharacterized protein LOC106666657 isoform X2 [Cimex lectularius]|uniref:Tubulin epsilon and delta complex protein 1 domain-containing protein n=1 Tax=Cimex lectularius TaxID=79782 RepID=A0A8I6TMG7_CIMLE|nr:uncharacterized protein LOC106666657 isoform X2 [Cimex lectularius]